MSPIVEIGDRETAGDRGEILRRGVEQFQHRRRVGRVAEQRAVVGAGDGEGDVLGGRGRQPVGHLHRVGDGQALAAAQEAEVGGRWIVGVADVDGAAVRYRTGQGERAGRDQCRSAGRQHERVAIEQDRRAPHHARRQRVAIVEIGDREIAGDRGEILRRGVEQFQHRRRVGRVAEQRAVVGAGDGEGDVLGVRGRQPVGHLHRVGDGQALATAQEVEVGGRWIVGVADVDGATVRYRTGQGERAGRDQCRSAGRQHERVAIEQDRRAPHHARRQRVAIVEIGDREIAGDRGEILRRGVEQFQHRRRVGRVAEQRAVVGAGDGEGDVLGGRGRQPVGHLHRVGDGQALAAAQEAEVGSRWIVGVADVDGAAVRYRTGQGERAGGDQCRSAGRQHERVAIEQDRRAPHHARRQRLAIVEIGDREIAGDRGEILRRGVEQFQHRRRVGRVAEQRAVVGAGDGEGDVLGGRGRQPVGHLHRVGDGQALATSQEVEVGGRWIVGVADVDGAAVRYRTGQGERAGRDQCRSAGRQHERVAIEQDRRAPHHARRQRVANVEIGDREIAGDRGEILRRGVEQFQHRRRVGRVAEQRAVVGAGDGDGDKLVDRAAMVVEGGDDVCKGENFTVGQLIECLRA